MESNIQFNSSDLYSLDLLLFMTTLSINFISAIYSPIYFNFSFSPYSTPISIYQIEKPLHLLWWEKVSSEKIPSAFLSTEKFIPEWSSFPGIHFLCWQLHKIFTTPAWLFFRYPFFLGFGFYWISKQDPAYRHWLWVDYQTFYQMWFRV